MRQFDGCCIIPGRLIPVMLSDKGGATKRGDARRSRNRGLLFSRENEKKNAKKKRRWNYKKQKRREKTENITTARGVRPSARLLFTTPPAQIEPVRYNYNVYITHPQATPTRAFLHLLHLRTPPPPPRCLPPNPLPQPPRLQL